MEYYLKAAIRHKGCTVCSAQVMSKNRVQSIYISTRRSSNSFTNKRLALRKHFSNEAHTVVASKRNERIRQRLDPSQKAKLISAQPHCLLLRVSIEDLVFSSFYVLGLLSQTLFCI